MKFLYITFISLFTLISIYAQEANFIWSDIGNNELVGLQNPTLVFPEDSGYTVYSIEKFGTQFYAPIEVHITKFDASSNIESSIIFKLPRRMQKDATLLKVVKGDGKLYFFSYIAVKKDKRNILYVQVYSNTSGTVSEQKEIYTLPIEKVNNSGFFEVDLSPNKSTFAVLVNKPFVKKTNEAIEVLLLDEELNILSNSKQELSFKSKRAYNEELFVENDATVTIVKKTDIFKKEPVTTILTMKDDNLIEQQVSSEKFYISDNRVITINNNQYLLGFATDNAKPAVSMGGAKDKSFFIYNISEKSLIKNIGWTPEILKKVLGKGFIDLKVKDILVDENDIYLIGDRFSKSSEAIEGANFKYNYTYNFGPGIVVKFNTDGEVAYQSYIKYGEEYMNKAETLGSFYPFLNNGKLQVLANEKESVLKDKKIVMGYGNINAKAIVLKEFDDSGNITTTPFWNSKVGGKNDLVSFAPRKTICLNNNSFYIYAMGGEYHRYGKMTLE